MTSKVFISYASRDLRSAERICAGLERGGLRCWMAHRDVRPGSDFAEEIVRSIRSSKVLLVVFSSHANKSKEMHKEIVLADQNGLLVIPVRVENIAASGAFEYQLATRQWVDLFREWDSGMRRLASRIATVVPPDRRSPAPAPPPRSPARAAVSSVPGDAGAGSNAAIAGPPPRPPSRMQNPSWTAVAGIAGAGAIIMALLAYALSASVDHPTRTPASVAAGPAAAYNQPTTKNFRYQP